MVGWHHRFHGHAFEQAPWDSKGQGSLACCSLLGRKESDMTEGTELNPASKWHISTIIVLYRVVSLPWKSSVICFPFHPPFLIMSCIWVTQYAVFSDWFLSLRSMHLSSLYVFSWLDSSFPFRTESTVWMYHSLFIYLLIVWYLGCF